MWELIDGLSTARSARERMLSLDELLRPFA
jgi:hypothetical protein